MLFDTDSGGSKGYEIQKSLRFRANSSAYLSRAVASIGDTQKWTYSLWVKRSKLGAIQALLDTSASGMFDSLYFDANDRLVRYCVDSSGTVNRIIKTSNAQYRDPSAWYHIVAVQDTTQAVAADRFRVYVNGVLQTLTTSVEVAQNWSSYINSARTHTIGNVATGMSALLDGYLAEVVFVDGVAVPVTSFGQVSAETGAWIPKKYTGTYGTNGFYLPFNDGSNLTNLTADRSGNGNNWTASNISLTTGVTYDWMDDTPTNNYPVLNPIANSGYSPVDGNLRVETNIGYNSCPSTMLLPLSGKYYFEYVCINYDGSNRRDEIGIIDNSVARTIVGMMANSAAYLSLNGAGFIGGTQVATYTGWAGGNIVMCAFDASTGKVWFGLDGVWNGNPSAGTGQCGTLTNNGNLLFCLSNSGDGQPYYTTRGHMNFGQRPFAYTPPTGFKSLCTNNLPTGTITTSGTFSGNASTDGPFVYLNGVPTAMTINGNAVTFGNHADKLANGFKVRSLSASYNSAGSNTYSITSTGTKFKYSNAQGNP